MTLLAESLESTSYSILSRTTKKFGVKDFGSAEFVFVSLFSNEILNKMR